ncbi:MAG: hypothetical protein R2741_15210 [Methanolobus sp.]
MNDSEKYTFANYGGEEFTPQPMEFGGNLVNGTTPMISEYNETERRHVYIQFYFTPTLEQRKMLEDFGVQFVRGIGIHAFIVSMPATYTAVDLPAESGLRWMGEIPVENKYDKAFGLNVPSWSRTDDGQVELEIHFYEDVTAQEGQSLADKYSSSTPELLYYANSNDPIVYGIVTEESNISLIASEDIVRIAAFPEPLTVPNDSGVTDNKQSSGFQFAFTALMILCATLYYRKN